MNTTTETNGNGTTETNGNGKERKARGTGPVTMGEYLDGIRKLREAERDLRARLPESERALADHMVKALEAVR